MPNVNDLKNSKFLTQHDVENGMLVTIEGYEEVNVAKEGADPQLRWILNFKECDKPLVLNSTNGQLISKIADTGDFDYWAGTVIVLYQDPTISFGGQIVGGIRVRAPKAGTVKQPANPPVEEDDGIPF